MIPAYSLTIGEILVTPLANAPDQEIIHAEVRHHSYREMRRRIGRLAFALTELGVAAGDVVGVMDWDSHRYLEAFFAVPMLGAVLHTINIRLSPEQILFTINHAKDDVILVHRDFLPMLAEILPRITRPLRLVLLDDSPAPIPPTPAFVGEYEALLARADPDFPFPQLDENTTATLFYTTGTTGDPKGVTYTHRQIVLHTLGFIAAIGPVPGMGGLHRADVYMPITPLFHVHGWGFPYIATLLGLRQVYPGRYEPARLLRLIADHGVTFSHCVPTILNMLLTAPESAGVDLSRWKVLIGGSALTPGLAQAARDRGIDIHAAYGMSETCPLLTTADMTASWRAPDDIGLRIAAGKAAPLVELSLRDDAMAPVPHDGAETAEITAHAPWLTEAYWANAEDTRALWRGGWLHTGDVGAIDGQGTLRISDRLKDVIKSGGEWISSIEIERIVSRVTGVREVAVIGLPDAKWGERPCLVMALEPGASAEGVTASVRRQIADAAVAGALPKWAMPERIVEMESLPKTSVGKIDKKRMRTEIATADQ